MTARLWEAVQVTYHPRGDSLGAGSVTLGGSARTPRDSTRAFNGASNGDPAGDSSPAATAPPTTKERDQEEGPSFHSLTASSTQRRTQTRPDQTSDSNRLLAWRSSAPFYCPGASPLPSRRVGEKS